MDVPGWHRDVERLPGLADIANAVWRTRRLRVRYRRWDGSPVDRVLDPLGLVLKAGVWYLVARSDGGIRTYRAARVDDLVDLGATFERPDGFDLAEYWRTWSRTFERRLYADTALVELSARGRTLVPWYLGSPGERALRETGGVPDGAGWSRAEVPVEAGDPALGQLLCFGPELRVLAPADLRRRMAEAVTRMGELYG